MITKITKEQEKAIPQYIKKWVELAAQPIDKKTAMDAVKKMYEKMGEKEPLIFLGNSPLNCYLLCILFFILIKYSGSQLDSQLYSQLNSQLNSQLYLQLDSQLYSRLNSQLYSQLNSQLNSQLYLQLDSQLSSQLNSQLYSRLYLQLNSQLDSRLDSWLDSQLNSQLGVFNLNYWHYDWAGYYDYGKYIGVKFDKAMFDLFINFVIQIPFIIAYKNIAFISEKPQIFWRNRRLHNENDMAIKYPDGYGFYFLHGVHFEKELWEKIIGKELKIKEMMSLQNIEQRMIALKYFGIENFLSQLNASLLDKMQPDYELYSVKELFSQPAYFLKYSCPSTGRIYVSGVDPKVGKLKDVVSALAWKFSMDKENYVLTEES